MFETVIHRGDAPNNRETVELTLYQNEKKDVQRPTYLVEETIWYDIFNWEFIIIFN